MSPDLKEFCFKHPWSKGFPTPAPAKNANYGLSDEQVRRVIELFSSTALSNGDDFTQSIANADREQD